MKLIYDYFDYESNYKPDYINDLEEAKTLVDYLVNRGYTYILKKDKALFKKERQVFVRVGDTEAKAITRAFIAYLNSHKDKYEID